jgi:hypothetical protein
MFVRTDLDRFEISLHPGQPGAAQPLPGKPQGKWPADDPPGGGRKTDFFD